MDNLQKVIDSMYKYMRPISTVANSIAMISLAVMMFLTAADVLLRKLANAPIMGSFEFTQFTMLICTGFGLAYCAVEKGHIFVDFITMRLSKKTQGILGIITGFLALVAGILLTWQQFQHIGLLQQSNQSSAVLMIPLYPFVGLLTFSLALYTIVLIIHFLEFIKQGAGK
jgi:TRAP-type C4-dicarboxylate transport system permease small subunit